MASRAHIDGIENLCFRTSICAPPFVVGSPHDRSTRTDAFGTDTRSYVRQFSHEGRFPCRYLEFRNPLNGTSLGAPGTLSPRVHPPYPSCLATCTVCTGRTLRWLRRRENAHETSLPECRTRNHCSSESGNDTLLCAPPPLREETRHDISPPCSSSVLVIRNARAPVHTSPRAIESELIYAPPDTRLRRSSSPAPRRFFH